MMSDKTINWKSPFIPSCGIKVLCWLECIAPTTAFMPLLTSSHRAIRYDSFTESKDNAYQWVQQCSDNSFCKPRLLSSSALYQQHNSPHLTSQRNSFIQSFQCKPLHWQPDSFILPLPGVARFDDLWKIQIYKFLHTVYIVSIDMPSMEQMHVHNTKIKLNRMPFLCVFGFDNP